MLFAIRACENIYGGLHGMESKFIIDCEDMNEAEDLAREASYELMDSYECIMNNLQEKAAFQGESIEDTMSQNLEYSLYGLNDEASMLSLSELDDMIWHDFEGFVEKYGVEE